MDYFIQSQSFYSQFGIYNSKSKYTGTGTPKIDVQCEVTFLEPHVNVSEVTLCFFSFSLLDEQGKVVMSSLFFMFKFTAQAKSSSQPYKLIHNYFVYCYKYR